MIYLTVQDVIAINVAVIQTYSPSEDIAVRDVGLLESAVNRPQLSAGGEDAYPSLFSKAAALLQSLACNHPFVNAKNRTAFVAMTTLLYLNGWDLIMDPEHAEEFVVDVVTNHLDVSHIAGVIEKQASRLELD